MVDWWVIFGLVAMFVLGAMLTFVVVQEMYVKPLGNTLCEAKYPGTRMGWIVPYKEVECGPKMMTSNPSGQYPTIENVFSSTW